MERASRPDMSGPHDRLRLLYLQHCPESVISNLLGRAAVFWTLEGQAALLQVVTCADAQALDPRYRKQILSRIVQFSASLPSLRQSSEGAAQHDQFVAALTSCRNDKANRYTSWSRSWACWQYMLTPTATVTVRARNKLGSEPGECVWDSAVALSAWLVSQPADSLQGRHAIELGAGTGLDNRCFPCGNCRLSALHVQTRHHYNTTRTRNIIYRGK